MTQNIDPREEKRVVTETETVVPAQPVKETVEETVTTTTEPTDR